jgi:hypothetical protein
MIHMFREDQSFTSSCKSFNSRSKDECVPFLCRVEGFFEEVKFFDVIEMIVKVRENLYVIGGMIEELELGDLPVIEFEYRVIDMVYFDGSCESV